MDLRLLTSFLAVARERSFSRAARKIHLAQPTVSQQIQELERELGTPLFLRRARQVTLTEAGRILEPRAARVLSAAEDARHAVQDLEGLTGGSLLIGAGTTPGVYVLPRVIADFQARYPGVELTLRIANSRVIEEEIRAERLDIGVVGGHVLGPGERCVAAGLLDELVLIVSPKHPWARRRLINGRALVAERLLIREPGSATRQVTERALQHAGIAVTRTMELDHTEAIKQFVMAGLGVAFVSTYAVAGEVRARQLAALRVSGLRIRRHFHVIHGEHRELSASARAFLPLLEPSTIRGRGAGESSPDRDRLGRGRVSRRRPVNAGGG
jgi:DNA-binding transcriptional LysR family regulator